MFENVIKHYQDFPIKGIDFIDIMPFLQDADTFSQLMHEINSLVPSPTVATVEARGFLFASPLLTMQGGVSNIVPIRKKGKLPFAEGDLRRVEIKKEYGSDEVFYRLSDIAAGRVDDGVLHLTFFDDVLATGGTALGIANALAAEKVMVDGRLCRVQVDAFVFLVELLSLGGAEPLRTLAPVHSIIKL
ncbi:MAG: hypothetical protein K5650_01730 [Bacteroidales bacterium]|nr:hypothetical protein [Bacteroidales bacterium]